MPKGEGKVVAQNKKAFHDYFIEETYEAGLFYKERRLNPSVLLG